MIELKKYPIKKDRLEYLAVRLDNTLTQIEKDKTYPLMYTPINNGPQTGFAMWHEFLALHRLLIDKDIKAAKQCYYIAELSRLRAYAEFGKSAQSHMHGILPNGFRGLLSDAQHLQPVYAALRHPDELTIKPERYWVTYHLVRMHQAALQKDWVLVTSLIERIKDSPTAKENWVLERLGFYRALCEESTPAVEAALAQLLSKESVKFSNKAFKRLGVGKFMCLPGMWLSKLAWQCGHEIIIKHPMIISELLPVEPLEHYDNPYDFLIDPVLENKPIKLYGLEDSVEEVERYNQYLYREKTGHA